MPEWLVLALVMAASCAVVLVVVLLRDRRQGPDEDTSQTPDVIEYITMMIGVVYAIVLGLAIAGVWEARNSATDLVLHEAQALHEVRERVAVYPAEIRQEVREDVDAYVSHVVNVEWPHMAEHHELTERGDELLAQVRKTVSGHEPTTTLESHAYQGIVDQVTAADRARVTRGQNAEPTMPGVVWFGLIVGAVVTVGMVFALQIRRSPRELLLAGLFSALIAFLLFLIWQFDAPFERDMAESVEPFRALFPAASTD
ncbi:DUF4239 domain-containing protein [Streptomyces durbertensis]|uniref:DUF4239 domain-containing protein n=1 Tax=Streptomyces durbertensis TaxID=2448886 RepID=A0ABR6EDH3_9ACTN|nr:DUF4239 domain-containing protein [Streptomyces durbertensis]MBB1243387.1 DUF4239 domain-containing protein [Streptomyces durbertensis]